MKSKEKKLTDEEKQRSINNYLEWAYADPRWREFTDRMVCEYIDTGVKPDIKNRFKEYLEGSTKNRMPFKSTEKPAGAFLEVGS